MEPTVLDGAACIRLPSGIIRLGGRKGGGFRFAAPTLRCLPRCWTGNEG